MPRKKEPKMSPEDKEIIIKQISLREYIHSSEEDKACKKEVINHTSEIWELGREYFLRKKWDSKFRSLNLSKGRKKREATKPTGELLIATYELLKELHAIHEIYPEIAMPWKSASSWFQACFEDFIATELDRVFSDVSTTMSKAKSSRHSVYLTEHEIVKKLKQYENPYTCYQDAKGLNTLALLGLKAINDSEVIKNKYWRTFITKYAAHVRNLNENENFSRVNYDPALGNKFIRPYGRDATESQIALVTRVFL